MKKTAHYILAAALAAGVFAAPESRAAYNEICIDLEGGVLMKLRVVSASYTSSWTRQLTSPNVKCLDIRRVPYGHYFQVEIDPTLWRRKNFRCQWVQRTPNPPARVSWKAKSNLWSQRCTKSKRLR